MAGDGVMNEVSDFEGNAITTAYKLLTNSKSIEMNQIIPYK